MGAERPPGLGFGAPGVSTSSIRGRGHREHTGAETGLAWPSLATLARLTGYSKATVKRAVRELDKGSHFTVTRLKVGKVNASNRYRPQNVSVSLGWGQSDPRGGVRVTPEPVNIEPVKVHTQRARVSCEDSRPHLVRGGRRELL